MSHIPAMDIYAPVTMTTLSRTQERLELQQLNDRFAAYVQRVRMLAEKNNQVDSSAVIKSTKAMEVEIQNLKNMYEQELEKLRKELESCNYEKTTHQVQVNKQMQYSAELQDRLNVETDKSGKLLDEINNYQRRVGSLEAEIQDLKIVATRPRADLEQMQRTLDNLTRENETWKHRYEHEQVARQEAESKIQQLMKRSEFNDKVNCERVGELNSRIELSAATILSLEAKVRDQSKTDVSVSELLKQVRDTAEAELKKYQMESEDQYNRNLTALKAQLDGDAKAIERLETERTQLRGSVGEFQARIRSLEGQVANLEHQKQTLEDAIAVERNRAADSARSLEHKLREVQEMLVLKMREVTTAREQNIPLKAEIEALKALLEEEEKRLRVPLGAVSTTTTTSTTLPLQETTSFTSAYNLTTTATAATTGGASVSFAPLPPPLSTTTTTTYPALCSTSSSAHAFQSSDSSAAIPTCQSQGVSSSLGGASTSAHNTVSFMAENRPSYVPSPPLSVTYIPDTLQPVGMTGTSVDPMYYLPQFEDELDPHLFGYSMPLPKYCYESSPMLNRVTVEPSPPTTPRAAAAARAQSAPAERHRNLNLVRSDLGQGHDYFDKMFHDLQRDTLYSRDRPKSSPLHSGRPLSSLYHDYSVSTSSATGDMKISEVHQDGKYVRLVNEGVQEIEFGGFMLQQNVGGHPVAVYRFPPRTKFAPNSTITVYSGCNSPKLHKPPHSFVWKEQQKWGTGPECTTILCRANGQAVAWTTAAHRFTRDAFMEGQNEPDDNCAKDMEEKPVEEVADDDSLVEVNVNGTAPRTEPVSLRREKQQPPSLHTNTYEGCAAAVSSNSRPPYCGHDTMVGQQPNSPPSCRADPVPGQPYSGAAAQKMGSAPMRKYVSGVSNQQPSARRCNGKSKKNFLNYLLNDSGLP